MSDPVPSLVGAKVLLRRAAEELDDYQADHDIPKLNADKTIKLLKEASQLCKNLERVLALAADGVVPATYYPNGRRAANRLVPGQWLYAASTKDSEG